MGNENNFQNNFKSNFTQIPNHVINDHRLTLKLKGLLIYLISKKDNWRFSAEGIVSQNKEGVSAVNAGLKDLEKLGYLERKRIISNGRFTGIKYILHDATYNNFEATNRKSTSGNSENGNSDLGNTIYGEPTIISNTNLSNTKESNNNISNNNSLFPSTEGISSKHKKVKVEKVLSHKEMVCKEAHKLVIDYFCLEYRPNYVFSGGKDATAVKGIISKIYDVQNKTSEPTVEVILSIFKLICAWLPTQNDFFKTADLPIINSKFNTIIESIKSKYYGANTFESKQSRFDKFC